MSRRKSPPLSLEELTGAVKTLLTQGFHECTDREIGALVNLASEHSHYHMGQQLARAIPGLVGAVKEALAARHAQEEDLGDFIAEIKDLIGA